MARPKVPLISRRTALEAALGIIDNEGLKALSIRRLGEVMNVNGASLYHHFANKDDILVGVTQLALADVTAPRSESDNWRVWLPLNAYRTRQALIAHPELIPIMLRRVPLGIGSEEVEASVARLLAEGVEMSVIAPLMESFELLAISSALQTVGGASVAQDSGEEATPEDSVYRQAQRERGLSDDELFEVVCAAVIASVESAVHLKEARASTGSAPAQAPARAGTAGRASAAAKGPAPARGRAKSPAKAPVKAAVPASALANAPASAPAKTPAKAKAPVKAATAAKAPVKAAAKGKPAVEAPVKAPASETKRTARSGRGTTARMPAATAGRARRPAPSGAPRGSK
jgi:TetR/AcrR family tetracycline transcriptional repressor